MKTPILKFKPFRALLGEGVEHERTLRDIIIERSALELAALTGESERRWQNILRWRIGHIGKAKNIRDMYDATQVRKVVGP